MKKPSANTGTATAAVLRDTPTLRLVMGGKICAGGCFYDDTPETLMEGYAVWKKCAASVAKSANEDTEYGYRLLGARAIRFRRAVARDLRKRAELLAGHPIQTGTVYDRIAGA